MKNIKTAGIRKSQSTKKERTTNTNASKDNRTTFVFIILKFVQIFCQVNKTLVINNDSL